MSVQGEYKDFYTMVCDFFGLREYPFHAAPSPRYLYLTEQYRLAFRRAVYSVDSRSGFAAIWGARGLGKTSMAYYLKSILPEIRPNVDVYFIESAGSITSYADTYRKIVLALGHSYYRNLYDNERTIKEILKEKIAQGRQPVFIIDEIQEASVEVLRTLRLLSNLEVPSGKLLQFVLFGSEEIFRKLDRVPALRDRIVFPTSLKALTQEEMSEMIRFRLHQAGADEWLFTPEQIEQIYLYSVGIPRSAVLICSNVLQIALDRRQRKITDDIVYRAIELFLEELGYEQERKKRATEAR